MNPNSNSNLTLSFNIVSNTINNTSNSGNDSTPSNDNEPEPRFLENLEEMEIPGKNTLHTLLSDSLMENGIPGLEQAIIDFQSHNGMIMPTLELILPLLHILGIKSLEFHKAALDVLLTKLINRIEDIGKMDSIIKEEKLRPLLIKAFPLIKMPMIQPIVMALLRNLDTIEDKYVKLLISDENLYKKCDVSVKRHIWQIHQHILVNELSPLLVQYIKEKEAIFADIKEPKQTFFLITPKQRRQNQVLQKLSQMVGKNVLLYDTILQFLRTVYLHTKNPHYCTLRVSLLMELHDANITDITSMDACHKFAWCLDACIRENTFDLKRVRELHGFLDNIKKGQEQVLGDLAMALVDPYAVNFLLQTVMRILQQLISNETLPREHQTLYFILRLLNLGLHAYEILDTQIFQEPKLNYDLVLKFLPTIMGFMVDDLIRSISSKLPTDMRDTAINIIDHCGPPSDIFQQFIQQDPLAALIAIYYCSNAAKQKDKQAVLRVLGSLTASSTYDNLSYSDPYQHILISGLINLQEEFSNKDLCSLVFDELFYPALNMNSTAIHLIKLIYHVQQWLPNERLENLLNLLKHFCQLPDVKPLVKQTFQELLDELEKFKEEKLLKQQQQQQQTQQQQQSSQQQSTRDGSQSVRISVPSTPSQSTTTYPSMMTPSQSSASGGPMSPFYSSSQTSGSTPTSPYSPGTTGSGTTAAAGPYFPYQPSPYHQPSSTSTSQSSSSSAAASKSSSDNSFASLTY